MLAIGAPEGRHKRFPPKRASVKSVLPCLQGGEGEKFRTPNFPIL